jgi:nitrogen regulatory protein PII-like uncharacterized protein
MIKINGKEFKYKLGYYAVTQYEENTGKSIADLANAGINGVIKFFYYGIRQKEGELTFEEFCDALDDSEGLMQQVVDEFTRYSEAAAALGAESKK